MELNDIISTPRSKSLNKLLSTRFGFDLNLAKINESTAIRLVESADREMKKVAKAKGDYQADATYLENQLVKETIEALQIERGYEISERRMQDDGSGEGNSMGDSKRNNALRMLVGSENFVRAKKSIDMIKNGEVVPPTIMQGLAPAIELLDDILRSGVTNLRALQMVDNRARKQLGMTSESHSRRISALSEGKTTDAELILASKDMVDRIQSMLVAVSEMKAESLIPLTDEIRDQMGNEIATSFMDAASGALDELLDSVTSARISMDNASRVLTGDNDEIGGVDLTKSDNPMMSMQDGDIDMDMGKGGDIDIGMDPGEFPDSNDPKAKGMSKSKGRRGGDMGMDMSERPPINPKKSPELDRSER